MCTVRSSDNEIDIEVEFPYSYPITFPEGMHSTSSPVWLWLIQNMGMPTYDGPDSRWVFGIEPPYFGIDVIRFRHQADRTLFAITWAN